MRLDYEIITVCRRLAVCMFIGRVKSSQISCSLSGFCGSCPNLTVNTWKIKFFKLASCQIRFSSQLMGGYFLYKESKCLLQFLHVLTTNWYSSLIQKFYCLNFGMDQIPFPIPLSCLEIINELVVSERIVYLLSLHYSLSDFSNHR